MDSFDSAPQPLYTVNAVGRERERAILSSTLDTVETGGRLVSITGAAGIGKSTLVLDTVDRARERGFAIYEGACYDGLTTAPYEPWHEALAPDGDGSTPDLASYLQETQTVNRAITDERSLAQAVVTRLHQLTADRPAVLALEDLHWADLASIELLVRVARSITRLPLLLIATWREAEGSARDFSAPLMNLVRSQRSEWIALGQLDDEDILGWIANGYGLKPADRRRLADVVLRYSDGNPLFVNELFRELELSKTIRVVDGAWELDDLDAIAVPRLVEQLIAGRLDQLDPDVRGLVETCAVLGQTFSIELLTAVSDLPPSGLARAISVARASQILRSTRRSADLEFQHALTREVLYQRVSEPVRQHLHLRAAEVLLSVDEPDANRVSAHLLEAGDERATEWLLRAGDRAERGHAWSDAIRRFESALDVLAASPDEEQLRGWLAYRIACLSRYSDLDLARERADDALEHAHAVSDPVLLAYTRYLRGLIEVFAEKRGRGIDDLLAAIDMLERLPDIDRLRLNATQGIFNPDALPLVTSRFIVPADPPLSSGLMTGDIDRRATVATLLAEAGRLNEALALSLGHSPGGDHNTESMETKPTGHMLQASAYVHALAGRPAESEAGFNEAERAFRDVGRTLMVADCLAVRLIVFEWPYRADRRTSRHASVAEIQRLGARLGEFEAPESSSDHWLVWSHFLEGRWELVSQLIGTPERSAFTGRRHQHIILVAATLNRELGNPDVAWQWLEHSLPDAWSSEPGDTDFPASVRSMVLAAELALDAGDADLAERWLRTHRRWMDWSGALLSTVEADLARARLHHLTGDLEAAKGVAFGALAAAVEPRQPLAQLAAQRMLSRILIDSGDIEAAQDHLDRALSLAEMCDVPHEMLDCRVAVVTLESARGEVSRARELAAEVRAAAAELPAVRVLTMLDGIEFERASGVDDLTERELEVLRVVARGRTDAEVADELFIATRTVNAHMRSIRSKLGVDTRMRAVEVARERDLL